MKDFEAFVSDPVKEWKKDFDPLSDEPQDFVEAYMQEVAKTQDPESSFYKALGGEHAQLIQFVRKLFHKFGNSSPCR